MALEGAGLRRSNGDCLAVGGTEEFPPAVQDEGGTIQVFSVSNLSTLGIQILVCFPILWRTNFSETSLSHKKRSLRNKMTKWGE